MDVDKKLTLSIDLLGNLSLIKMVYRRRTEFVLNRGH